MTYKDPHIPSLESGFATSDASYVPKLTEEAEKDARPWFWAIEEESEEWNGPCSSKRIAMDDADETIHGYEAIWVGQGTECDPSKCLNSWQSLWNFEQENPEDCPPETGWLELWGLTDRDYEALDDLLRDTFRAWVKARGLARYWTVSESEEVRL